MPRLIRRNANRRGWTLAHLLQLRCGFQFLASDWSDPVDTPPEQRDEWPPAAMLADMRACWAAHGNEVKATCAGRQPGLPSWGELVFERGMTPQEAFDYRSPYTAKE
jgi:hypothetical protein